MKLAQASIANFEDRMRQALDGRAVMVSPTFLKNYAKCGRKALLSNFSDLSGSFHIQYGHAFGEAAALLCSILRDKPNVEVEAALGKCLITAARHYPYMDEPIPGKSLLHMYEALHLYYCQLIPSLRFYKPVDTEVKVILLVDGKYYLSGTYDQKFQHLETGLCHIDDYKAVTSSYMYSWATEPQVPFYTVINQVAANIKGTGELYAPHGGYIVHEAKSEEKLLSRHDISRFVWQKNLKGIMRDALTKAKIVESVASRKLSFEQTIDVMPASYYSCSPNGFDCEFLRKCSSSNSVALTEYNDDRRPSDVVHIPCTTADIMYACDQLSSLVVESSNIKITDASEKSAALEAMLGNAEAFTPNTGKLIVPPVKPATVTPSDDKVRLEDLL